MLTRNRLKISLLNITNKFRITSTHTLQTLNIIRKIVGQRINNIGILTNGSITSIQSTRIQSTLTRNIRSPTRTPFTSNLDTASPLGIKTHILKITPHKIRTKRKTKLSHTHTQHGIRKNIPPKTTIIMINMTLNKTISKTRSKTNARTNSRTNSHTQNTSQSTSSKRTSTKTNNSSTNKESTVNKIRLPISPRLIKNNITARNITINKSTITTSIIENNHTASTLINTKIKTAIHKRNRPMLIIDNTIIIINIIPKTAIKEIQRTMINKNPIITKIIKHTTINKRRRTIIQEEIILIIINIAKKATIHKRTTTLIEKHHTRKIKPNESKSIGTTNMHIMILIRIICKTNIKTIGHKNNSNIPIHKIIIKPENIIPSKINIQTIHNLMIQKIHKSIIRTIITNIKDHKRSLINKVKKLLINRIVKRYIHLHKRRTLQIGIIHKTFNHMVTTIPKLNIGIVSSKKIISITTNIPIRKIISLIFKSSTITPNNRTTIRTENTSNITFNKLMINLIPKEESIISNKTACNIKSSIKALHS